MIKRSFLAGALSLLAISVLPACSAAQKDTSATYYLVRHAEKQADQPDPRLTEGGEQRAHELRVLLKDKKLTHVYSTKYNRTWDTAIHVADEFFIPIERYDGKDLESFAEDLKSQSGNILVVGHSDTTPKLAELLGGEPGEPIVEDTEYNRMYVITRKGGEVTSEITRYGPPNPAGKS